MKFIKNGIVLGAVLANPASIAQKAWSGTAGNTLWSAGENWSPAGAPGASDNVTFTNDGVSDNPIVLGGSANNVLDHRFYDCSMVFGTLERFFLRN